SCRAKPSLRSSAPRWRPRAAVATAKALPLLKAEKLHRRHDRSRKKPSPSKVVATSTKTSPASPTSIAKMLTAKPCMPVNVMIVRMIVRGTAVEEAGADLGAAAGAARVVAADVAAIADPVAAMAAATANRKRIIDRRLFSEASGRLSFERMR